MAFHGRVAFSIGIASTGKEEKKQGKMHYDMMIPYLGQVWDIQRFWDEIEAGKSAQLPAYMHTCIHGVGMDIMAPHTTL
ncbi:MAG TPA: hypothetical protein VGP12_02175 [Nitrosospira sp.]|jgi:hypothetical protein|nr:hypothetical protein [Nitrosospira sp.]